MDSQNLDAPIKVKRLAQLLDELIAYLNQRLANGASSDEIGKVQLIRDTVISAVEYLRQIGLDVDAARLKAAYNRLYTFAKNVWLHGLAMGQPEAFQDLLEESQGIYPRPADDEVTRTEDEESALLAARQD